MSIEPKVPLASCPFCAGIDLMILPHRFTMIEVWHEVSCKACGAGCGVAPSLAQACVKWNTRKGSNELGDVASALPISAIVYGMMHKIPTAKMLEEVERRGGL